MSPRPRRRRALSLLAAAAVVAGAAIAPTPAAADAATADALLFVPFRGQTTTVWRNGNVIQRSHVSAEQVIEGDFTTAPGSDVFLYTPGSALDGLFHVTPSGTSATTSFTTMAVAGDYQPVVGDFDGNGLDDILWYAPGPAADALWLFKAGGGYTSVSLSISGSYRPFAVHTDGDGYEDVIWYAPGAGADSIWRFGPGGARTSSPVSIAGDYQLAAGSFGQAAEGSPQRRVVFYSKTGTDHIWTFDAAGGHTTASLDAGNGAATPVIGYFTSKYTQTLLLYRPGAAAETFIGFTTGGAPQGLEPPPVSGTYDPVTLDLDGNEYTDIAWTANGRATVWKFNGGGYSQATIVTNTVDTHGAATEG